MPELDDSALANAAFGLLTSSTVDGYEREARRAAAPLRRRIVMDPGYGPRLLLRAQRLAIELLSADRRSEQEVELATILAALGGTGIDALRRPWLDWRCLIAQVSSGS